MNVTSTVVQDGTVGLSRQNPVLCFAWLSGEQFDNTDHVHVARNIFASVTF